MTLNFDLNSVRTTEFGVGTDEIDEQTFCNVTVDQDVQNALRDIALATTAAMQDLALAPTRYEPSEKYGGHEYVYLPIGDVLVQRLKDLHEAQNLPTNNFILDDTSKIFCYFARFTDTQGRQLTAIRRANQFKGVLKSRLIRIMTDALRLIEDRVFKLDNDFDILIDSRRVHILRPSSFEFIGKLQGAVLAAVPQNIAAIQTDLPFVELGAIQTYATKHPRAARYLASIRGSLEMQNIDKTALKRLCRKTGVDYEIVDNKLVLDEENAMGFLEILDRRRYEIDLVKDSPERFRAGSRERIVD